MSAPWQYVAVLAVLCAPGKAMSAEDLVPRPAACEPVVTVQARGCSVETVLRCNDPAGWPWRAEVFDAEGLRYVSSFTKDFVQVQVRLPAIGLAFDYDPELSSSTPPVEMAETGHGVERVKGFMSFGGQSLAVVTYNEIRRVEPLDLDGRRLVSFRVVGTRTTSPPLQAEAHDFMNYLDPETGALFGGESLLPGPDGKLSQDGRPAALAFPGDPGFDAKVPVFDCGNLSFNQADEKADFS